MGSDERDAVTPCCHEGRVSLPIRPSKSGREFYKSFSDSGFVARRAQVPRLLSDRHPHQE